MSSRNVILIIIAAVVVVGAAYVFVGSSRDQTEGQPAPHAIDQ